MLIPQFSLRLLLGVTAACSVVFSIVALAIRGQGWAIGVSVAVCSLVLIMAVYAALFGLVWMVSLLQAQLPKRGGSPFRATGGSPFRLPASTPVQAEVVDPPAQSPVPE